MFKTIFTLFVCCVGLRCYAKTQDVPEAIRLNYASKFHEAFVLQSYGLSTKAFFTFKDAYQSALQAGEVPQKVYAMESLFRWYRTHGSPMRLFAKEPTGSDVIVPDPRERKGRLNLPLYHASAYESEYGRTPEQAGHVREFMFGVANTISGVFYVTVAGIGGVSGAIAIGALSAGIYLMFNSLNSAYVDYERAKLDLQGVEANMKKACAEDK